MTTRPIRSRRNDRDSPGGDHRQGPSGSNARCWRRSIEVPLIVGDPADPHVRAVLARMTAPATVIDAAAILALPVSLTAEGLTVHGERITARRGWLRRLAPDGWAEHLNAPGVDAAVRASAVSTLAAIARDERTSWLTKLDNLGAAENKPFQYRRAAAGGVPVPRWIVTTSVDDVPTEGSWVSKPLGPGSFIDGDGRGRIVPTSALDVSEPWVVAGAPFVVQARVEAHTHARIVTVRDRAFSATLPADDLPLDWRLDSAAHRSFSAVPVPDSIHELALIAAQSVGVGYTAQDWIRGHDGTWWLVDLNPAGQWLFLPEDVAGPVTLAISRFLDGGHTR